MKYTLHREDRIIKGVTAKTAPTQKCQRCLRKSNQVFADNPQKIKIVIFVLQYNVKVSIVRIKLRLISKFGFLQK